MNYTSTRSVVESGILTALMIVFAMIGLSVPMLGFFGSILVPMTIAVVGVRHGFRWSILSVVSAVIAIAFLLGPLTALIEGGVFGVIGILIGYGLRKQWSVSRLLIFPAIVLMLAVVVQFWASAWVMNLDPAQMWTSLGEQLEETMRDMYVNQGLSEEQGKKEEKQINPSNIMKQVFPYFFIFLAIDGAISFLGHNFINHIDAALALIGK